MYEYLFKQFIFLLAETYFAGRMRTHNLQTCNFARNKSQNAGEKQQNRSADNIDQFNIVVLFDYRFLAQLSNGMCITHPSIWLLVLANHDCVAALHSFRWLCAKVYLLRLSLMNVKMLLLNPVKFSLSLQRKLRKVRSVVSSFVRTNEHNRHRHSQPHSGRHLPFYE